MCIRDRCSPFLGEGRVVVRQRAEHMRQLPPVPQLDTECEQELAARCSVVLEDQGLLLGRQVGDHPNDAG
eukprot:9519590-Alexandrium_andersonii.AAC.1